MSDQTQPDRRTLLKGIAGTTIASTAGCISGMVSSGSNNTLHKFKHGLSFESLIYYPILLAQEKGYYKEENVGVSASIGMGGGQAMKQVVGGNMRINANAMDPLILARNAGGDVSQIMTYLTLNHGLVTQDKYKSFDDLPEDEIVVGISSPTSGSTASALYMLAKNGINVEKRVTQVQTGGSSERYAAIQEGEVDVAACVLEVAMKADTDKDTHVLSWSYESAGDYNFIGSSVNNKWVDKSEENYKAAVHHTTATLRALRYGLTKPDKFKSFLVDKELIGDDKVDKYYNLAFDKGIISKGGNITPGNLSANFQGLNTIGELQKPYPEKKKLLRKDIYNDAVKRLKDEYSIQMP